MKYNSGFSIIEISFAVIISIIIVSVSIIEVRGLVDIAKQYFAQQQVETLNQVSILFFNDMGRYPENSTELAKTINGKGPWLKKEPIDPWGDRYEIKNNVFYSIHRAPATPTSQSAFLWLAFQKSIGLLALICVAYLAKKDP